MTRIFEHKLSVPINSSFYSRKRLHTFLEMHIHYSFFSIAAGAGYGKTTLISEFVKEKNTPTVWYNLDETDQSPLNFLSYLHRGLLKITDNQVHSSQSDVKEFEEEFHSFLSTISNRVDPLFIVLDNYHILEQNMEVQTLLTELLQYSSPSVTFFFIGHTQPNAIPVKLKVRRKHIEISKDQLAFTIKETDEFIRTQHGIQLTDFELNMIQHHTKGWVTGIQLILQSIVNLSEEERKNLIANFSLTEEIRNYFHSELMKTLTPELKNFMYQTSLLNDLDESTINLYLDINNAKEYVAYLMNWNLFVYMDEQRSIRYHPLFRTFLYEELINSLNESHLPIEEYHLKLAEVYKNKSQFFSSFAHFVSGKNYYKATRLIRMLEKRYNPDQFFVLISNWLESAYTYSHYSIPFDTVFLFRSIPLSILDQLVAPIEKYITVLENTNNHHQLCHLYYFLASIYRQKGEFDQAKSLFQSSLEYSEGRSINVITILNLLGLSEISLCLGNQLEAEKYAKDGLFLSEKFQIIHCQIYALWKVAEISIFQNQMENADQLLKQMKVLLDSTKEDDARSVYYYYSLSRLLLLMKDYSRAISTANIGVEKAEKFGNDLDLGGSYLQLGQSLLTTNNLKKAEYYLNKAYTSFEYFSYYRCLTIDNQIHLFELQGDLKKASEKRKELISISNEKNYSNFKNQRKEFTRKIIINDPVSKCKSSLSINVFGKFNIIYDGKPVHIKRKASLQLLKLLIVNRGKKIQKDILLDNIFPESSIDTINNHFYVALSILRKSLEPKLQSGKDSKYISQIDNHYIFNHKNLYLDVDHFQELLVSDNLSNQSIQMRTLLSAEKLYKGHFFEEYPYEPFLEQEREKLRTEYIHLLRKIADFHWESSDNEKGIEYYEKILLEDPYQEQLYIEYIKKLLNNHLFLQAKNVAARNIKFVENELGIDVRSKLNNLFSHYSFSV
ncbi:BTAD domain-containing putative transcriptional regulator [Rossellomorea aquimaris]|uniref:BTAD domain-containing putative transcriptional regulator n=1 Tax=Rossellomorea aquimaris TaxID=189382 RepID=UPI003CEB1D1A